MHKLWQPCHCSNPSRQDRNVRKSERLRLIEMQLLRLEFQIESLNAVVQVLLDMNNMPKPELDAGKWYQRKMDGNR